MSSRRHKKQQRRPIVVQRPPTAIQATTPLVQPGSRPIWTRIPGWLWSVVTVASVTVGFFVLYPTLSLNEDFAFDELFPYNTSFSITNEGYWTLLDLSSSCLADFTVRPWPSATNQNDQSSMTLHTDDTNHQYFAQHLHFKERVSLPCNHNVVANGHLIDPGAKLRIMISYRFAGIRFRRSQTFNLSTVVGWGKAHWQFEN